MTSLRQNGRYSPDGVGLYRSTDGAAHWALVNASQPLLWPKDVTVELRPGPTFGQTTEGRLLGHVHLGLRLVEGRAAALEAEVRAELLHAVSCHHELRAARTAEAAVLYHANQLDAVAATRPVSE